MRSVHKDKRSRDHNSVYTNGHLPIYGFVAQNVMDSDTSLMRNIVVNEDLAQMSSEIMDGYSSKCFMSLDGLFRPISIDGGDKLPRFAAFSAAGFEVPITGVPVTGVNLCAIINQDDLNPFTNPAGLNRSYVSTNRSDTPDIGHDIEIVARSGSGQYGSPPYGLILRAAGVDQAIASGVPVTGISEDLRDYTDNYRPVALRGPLIVSSWTYDTEGAAMPNKADTPENASQGIYVDSSTSGFNPDKFMDNHLQRPDTWVTAPVDLRFDRNRGVYVASGNDNFIVGTIMGDIEEATSGSATCGMMSVFSFDTPVEISGTCELPYTTPSGNMQKVYNVCGHICAGSTAFASKTCGLYIIFNVCQPVLPDCSGIT